MLVKNSMSRLASRIGTAFVICFFIGSCVALMVNDKRTRRAEARRNYESGKWVRIDGQRFAVTKTKLANGECYYVYDGYKRSFTIPCEEK